jgi:DNA invertase Pin-like site-specific DNA recombinase
VREPALKGIGVLIRRSSRAQEKNEGSHELQRNQSVHFPRYGIADLPVTVFDRIESAKDGVERETVAELIGMMLAGSLGLIVIAYGSRLTRSEVEGARLIEVATKMGVLFMVKGEILNPREQHQHARLMDMIVTAVDHCIDDVPTRFERKLSWTTAGSVPVG